MIFKKTDIVRVVGLSLVIVACAAFFMFMPRGKELSYSPIEIPGSLIAASASTDAEVHITTTLVQPGYVTIHQSISSAPGPMIGVSGYMDVGENQAMTIMTSEAMTPQTSYVALLHVDNGDGHFVVTEDMPVTSNGQSVRADFIAP